MSFITYLYNQFRGRQLTRSPNASSTPRSTVRSPSDRMQSQTPPSQGSHRSTTPTQEAVHRPLSRHATGGTIVRAEVGDDLILQGMRDRDAGPFPFAFRNVREALLGVAHASDFESFEAPEAVSYVLSHVQPRNYQAIVNEALKLGAHDAVDMLGAARINHTWGSEPMDQFEHGPIMQMRPRDMTVVPGGIVTVAHNDSFPVRFWHKGGNGWSQTTLLPMRKSPGKDAFVPNAVTAVKDGFAVFDDAGGIQFFPTPKPNQGTAQPTQTIPAGRTRQAWTAASALGDDRLVATTRGGSVHIFKRVNGAWSEEKSLKTGHALNQVAALDGGFAVSGPDSETITIFDQRFKAQKLACDRPVSSLTPLTDGTLLSIDAKDHAQVWSQHGKKWSSRTVTYAASRAVAVKDGFVCVTKDFITHWRKEGDKWLSTAEPITLNGGVKSEIRALCKTSDGIAVMFEQGPERLTEVRSALPWMLDWNQAPGREPTLFEALRQGNLALAQELVRNGEMPDPSLMRIAATLQFDDVDRATRRAANELLKLAYSENVDLVDKQGHTLAGLALSNGTSPDSLLDAAQHIALGAKVTDGDVAKALHMASVEGMFPVLAALILRGRLKVEQLPATLPHSDAEGFTLALAIARLEPVNAEQVRAAGQKYGFLPRRITGEEQQVAALNMFNVVKPAELLVEFSGRYNKSPAPLVDAMLLFASEDGAASILKQLVALGDFAFWGHAPWESYTYSTRTARRLREAGMPGPILARYAATRPPQGWTPPLILRAMSGPERAHWLYTSVAQRAGEVSFSVKRNDSADYAMALEQLCNEPFSWQQNWRIKYKGEDGIDAGGLSRDWVNSALAMLVGRGGSIMPTFPDNKTYAYFKSDDSTLIGNKIAPQQQTQLEQAGRLYGRAIMLGITHGIELPPHLLDVLAGRAPKADLEALQNFDPVAARGLQWMLDHPEEVATLDQTFSIDETGEVVSLVAGIAPTTKVDASNVQVYVDAQIEHILTRRFQGATEHFLRGVYSVVDARLLRNFSAEEIADVTAGNLEFDTAQWRAASAVELVIGNAQQTVHLANLPDIVKDPTTPFHGAKRREQLVEWFFQALEQLDNKSRAIIFEAVTASKRVPGAGFSALPAAYLFKFSDDWGEHARMDPSKPFANLGLPKAATCDSSLTLHDYPDAQTLKDALVAYIANIGSDMSFGLK